MPAWVWIVGGSWYAAAMALGGDAWLIAAQPSAARVHGSLGLANLLWLVGCVAVILVGRRAPAWRDHVHAALGAVWMIGACGWRTALALTAVALLVYAVGRRLQPHVAMLLSALLLVALARQPAVHLPRAGLACVGFACLRIVYYAFDQRSIRRSRRSLVSMLAYGPLSLLLWPGPIMLSYPTYVSERPRAQLDALAARQLLWGTGKLLAAATLVYVLSEIDLDSFATLRWSAQALVVLAPYPLYLFQLSIRQDLAAAMCNLSGHYAPSAFRYPVFASNLFELWRRWNVHVVDFLRRAFIYEVARRRRSIAFAVLAGMMGTFLFHVFKHAINAGPAMGFGIIRHVGVYYAWGTIGLLFSIPIERRRKQLPRAALIVLTILVQLGAAIATFCLVEPELFFGRSLPMSAPSVLGVLLRIR